MNLFVKVEFDENFYLKKAFEGHKLNKIKDYAFICIEENQFYLEVKDFLYEYSMNNKYMKHIYIEDNDLYIDLTKIKIIEGFTNNEDNPFLYKNIIFDHEIESPEQILSFVVEKLKENELKKARYQEIINSNEFKSYENKYLLIRIIFCIMAFYLVFAKIELNPLQFALKFLFLLFGAFVGFDIINQRKHVHSFLKNIEKK